MGRFVPMYGLMIMLGIFAASAAAWQLVKRNKYDPNHLLILIAYGLLGGMAGAKILFLLININSIDWSRILDLEYLKVLMSSGFVFYGGLIGGLGAVFLGGKIHKIRVLPYLEAAIPCLPIAHGFGRIGCHFASCCYGIPYDGPFHVIYHTSEYMATYAPVDTPLFPVQLLEAVINFGIAAFLIFRTWKKGLSMSNIYLYLLLYGISRFLLEYLRYDLAERGSFLWFSTSQWISILILAAAVVLLRCGPGREKKEPEKAQG